MFTVKHFRTDGRICFSTCEAFEVDTTVTPHGLQLINRGSKSDFVLYPGESVYIETLLGKSVTGIRNRVD